MRIIEPPSRADRARLMQSDIPIETYTKYELLFSASLRAGCIQGDGRRVRPSEDPRKNYPKTHAPITMGLTGDKWTQLYPSFYPNNNQRYFVIRLLPDDSHNSLWSGRLSQIQRYAAVIDLFGVPGAVFSQTIIARESQGLGRTIDMYYFMDKPQVCEAQAVSRGDVPLGRPLLDLLSQLYETGIPRRLNYNPLENVDAFSTFYDWRDIANGMEVRVQTEPYGALNRAIRISMANSGPGEIVSDVRVISRSIYRSGLVPDIERHLYRAGIDVRTSRIQVLPSRRHPADLPLRPGSYLLHPITLTPLTATPKDAMQMLFVDGGPQTRSLASLFAASATKSAAEFWRPDDRHVYLGILPVLARREWLLGRSCAGVVAATEEYLKRNAAWNRWWDVGHGFSTSVICDAAKECHGAWGEPPVLSGAEFAVESVSKEVAKMKNKFRPSFEYYWPPEGFAVPLSWVRSILALNFETQGKPGRKMRILRDFDKEERILITWKLFRWCEKNGRSAEPWVAELHSQNIKRIPGMRKPAHIQDKLLREAGIVQLSPESDPGNGIARKYSWLLEMRPPAEVPGEPLVTALQEGIALLLSKDEIGRSYSRRRRGAILALMQTMDRKQGPEEDTSCRNKDGHTDSLDRYLEDPALTIA